MGRTVSRRWVAIALVGGAALSIGMARPAGAAELSVRVQLPTTPSFGVVTPHPVRGRGLELDSDTVYQLPGVRVRVQVIAPCDDCRAPS